VTGAAAAGGLVTSVGATGAVAAGGLVTCVGVAGDGKVGDSTARGGADGVRLGAGGAAVAGDAAAER